MATKVLIVDIHAELYRDRLQREFSGLQFLLFHTAAEISGDLSAIDIMIMFGIEIRDQMLRNAPRLKWIQSLATGWTTSCAVRRCGRMFSLRAAAAFTACRCASTSST